MRMTYSLFTSELRNCPNWILTLNKCLNEIIRTEPEIFPDLSNCDNLLCISDYAGENQNSTNHVMSFLAVNYDELAEWFSIIHGLRNDYLGNKTMDYKTLGKCEFRRRALVPFLNATHRLNGILFTLVVDRSIRWLFRAENKLPGSLISENGLGNWKDHIAEKLLRILHVSSLLISGLSNSKTTLHWYTDRDAITDKTGSIDNIRILLGRILSIYCPSGLKGAYVDIVPEDQDGQILRDLMAIPDLAAGALVSYYESLNSDETNTSLRSDVILDWYAQPEPKSKLKRLICRVSPTDSKDILKIDCESIKLHSGYNYLETAIKHLNNMDSIYK